MLSEKGGLEILSLLINNSCNLACKHCYLHSHELAKRLAPTEWQRFLTSAFTALRPSVVCFAGKEVFVDEDSAAILLDAVKLRNACQPQDRQTQIGVMTNGALLHQYRAQLDETSPDYWDVSVDGLPAMHDSIRGAGAFAQLAPNLAWLLERAADRVWLTHTLFETNLNSLPDFVSHYATQFGVRNFSVGFYQQLANTEASLALTDQQYHELIFRVLPRLATIPLSERITVRMEFDLEQLQIIPLLIATGWAEPNRAIAFRSHEFDNGLTLRIDTVAKPIGLWRSVGVSAEGDWLSTEDVLYPRERAKAVANVRDHDYDAVQLYGAGLRQIRYLEQDFLSAAA